MPIGVGYDIRNVKYYKHSQLVKTYNVSDRTVRNWVDATLEGKVGLELHERKGRHYVADTVANQAILGNLAEHGRKYRNSRSHKEIKPAASFYKLFNDSQLTDLVNVLDKNHELPWSYSYFGEAAHYWDEQLMEMHSVGKSNMVSATIESVRQAYPYIESAIEQYERVNVVAVCPGNGVVLHDVLSRLRKTGKLNRFVAVDISSDMLDATERNVERWFGEGFGMERRVTDVRYQVPEDILTDKAAVEAEKVINLFFLVGGPLVNFERPEHVLRNINACMAKQDILVTTVKRGRVRECRLREDALVAVATWTAHQQALWSTRLDALGTLLEDS